MVDPTKGIDPANGTGDEASGPDSGERIEPRFDSAPANSAAASPSADAEAAAASATPKASPSSPGFSSAGFDTRPSFQPSSDNDDSSLTPGVKGALIAAALVVACAAGYAFAVYRETPRIAALETDQATETTAPQALPKESPIVPDTAAIVPPKTPAKVTATKKVEEKKTATVIPQSKPEKPVAKAPQKNTSIAVNDQGRFEEECCSDAPDSLADDDGFRDDYDAQDDIALAPGPRPLGETPSSEPYFNEDMIDAPRPLGPNEMDRDDDGWRDPDSSGGRW